MLMVAFNWQGIWLPVSHQSVTRQWPYNPAAWLPPSNQGFCAASANLHKRGVAFLPYVWPAVAFWSLPLTCNWPYNPATFLAADGVCWIILAPATASVLQIYTSATSHPLTSANVGWSRQRHIQWTSARWNSAFWRWSEKTILTTMMHPKDEIIVPTVILGLHRTTVKL